MSLAAAIVSATSCDEFLKEEPKTFLSPDTYFTTESQMQAAVDGLYIYLDYLFDGDVEVGTQRYVFMEYLHGYGERKRSATSQDLSEANSLTIAEDNTNLESIWQNAYSCINNANTVISGISSSTADVDESTKNDLLGQAYFFRAYFYFDLVRLWGPVVYSTDPTTDLSNTQAELTSEDVIYDGIVSDLQMAESLLSSWSSSDGHVAKAAAKALLAKVYITMAGYPLELGSSYYTLAYEKAKEVVDGAGISLYSTVQEMREAKYSCGGEVILTIECEADYDSNPLHSALLPYPEVSNISDNSAYGGAVAATDAFYNSFAEGDARAEDFGYLTTQYNALDGGSNVEVDATYVYKFFDTSAASNSGKSAMSYPLIRYADVLLLMAEAKAQADGGTTTDSDAISAYYQVRSRSVSGETRPSSLSFDTVYKERIWELCFETQTWFDMIRTRKALNTTSGLVVNLIGYQTPGHSAAFEEADLLMPYPLRDVRLNPNLKRKTIRISCLFSKQLLAQHCRLLWYRVQIPGIA